MRVHFVYRLVVVVFAILCSVASFNSGRTTELGTIKSVCTLGAQETSGFQYFDA